MKRTRISSLIAAALVSALALSGVHAADITPAEAHAIESPGKDKEANWLPAPKAAFNLCIRVYGPRSEAVTGKWNPPPVVKVEGPSEVIPQ